MRTPDTTVASLRRFAAVFICLLVVGLATACAPGGGGEEGAEPESPAAEEHAGMEHAETASSDAPRVWFIEPEDGATVTSPVTFRFGAENIMIEPKGDVIHGSGHHHIGVDTDCLPPGELIPEADPWIHFGDASATIEMQLAPGEHQLALQLGDGEHRTLDEPGLCQVITITVVEEESDT